MTQNILYSSDRVAVLLHGVSWGTNEGTVEIAPNICICKSESSKPLALYESMCELDGLDEGEGYSYGSYLDIRLREDEHWLSTYPTSLVEDLCNIIVINTGAPISLCRVIYSKDDYNSAWVTMEPFENTRQLELFDTSGVTIDTQLISKLTTSLKSLSSINRNSKKGGRVHSAFDFYHYSWRSLFYDQTCIC